MCADREPANAPETGWKPPALPIVFGLDEGSLKVPFSIVWSAPRWFLSENAFPYSFVPYPPDDVAITSSIRIIRQLDQDHRKGEGVKYAQSSDGG